MNSVADTSHSVASRIARHITFHLLSSFDNALYVLGAIGTVAYVCFALTPPQTVERAYLPRPSDEREFQIDDALGYTFTTVGNTVENSV
jgi:hypothetical protein